jgi:hypothetical protein
LNTQLKPFLYSLLLAVCFLLVKGYYFNTDDQAEHLPQVYQILDPDLYTKDYFVPYSNSITTVRYYYEQLMLAVDPVFGIELFSFLLTLLCITVIARSVMGISESFFPKTTAKWMAPILVLFVFYGFTVGGNHITYPSLISSTLAKAFAVFSFWKFLQGKYLLAGLTLGFGALFQPLVGLQLAMLLVGTRFLLHPKELKPLVQFSFPFVAVACLILMPVLLRQGDQKALESGFYWEVLFRFRNYHHYFPSLFPIGHFAKAIGLAAIGLFSFAFLKSKMNRFYFVFVGLGMVGMLAYALGLEMNVLPQIGKTQWFKTSIWIGLLSAVGVAGFLVQLPKVSWMINRILPGSLILFGLSTAGLVLLLNSAFIPNSAGKYMIGNREVPDIEKMHQWIEGETEKDILVLVPPNDNSFSCQAKRSIPIHFTAIVHEPKFMLDWYDRYSKIYGVSLENLKKNAKDDAVTLYQTRNYRGSEYGIDYRLDDLETCQFNDELGPIIHQEGSWVLTEFLPSN